MKYPEEFVERVVKEYFGWPGISEMLRPALILHDSAKVENLLDIGKGLAFNISPDKIIEDLDAGRVEQVKVAMERCIRREKLYYECIDMRLSGKPVSGNLLRENSLIVGSWYRRT